jgi:hypothetical protein|tara:strand:+ start:5225 stop:7774 length:2550 start_codon:yes stop_codon:yes gene_type:complete
MSISGVVFEKKKDVLTKRVLDFFERTRYSYLSALEDPKEYGKNWKRTVKSIRTQFDSLDAFTGLLKKHLDEDIVFDDNVEDPTSMEARKLYDAVKSLRFESKEISDPFSEQLGDNVIETLLSNNSVFAAFIHYALRAHSMPLPESAWKKHNLSPDEITQGAMGLDLEVKDIPLYISEHYGDDKNTKRIKTKFKSMLSLLEKVFLEEYTSVQWNKLVDINIKKSEEKSEEEKSEINFIVPNKPMYRIFELNDMEQLKGFTGEYVVQEKYDGMRVQLHKIDGKVKIYSYNQKDITEKCKEQVEQLNKKQFGDCILDGELMLFRGEEPLHRASVINYIFKKPVDGLKLRLHVFDIMRHEERDLMDVPLRERINILMYQYSQHSSEDLAFPSKKDTRIADSIKEVGTYAETIMQLPASEGVVIKDIESTYQMGSRKNPKWVKWKKFVDLDVIVLDSKKTKSDLYSYSIGIGPVTAEEARKYTTKELDDKAYIPVGKALNTKQSVEVGSIVRVKVDEVKKTKEGFSLYSAKVIEIPEVTQSDKLSTLELLSDKTKKSIWEDLDKPFKYRLKGVKKMYITDDIHGEAEIILKSDFDGFTIMGFSGDNLMEKKALYDIDVWKEDLKLAIKTIRSELRLSIKNKLIEIDEPVKFEEVLEFVKEHHMDRFESTAFDGDVKRFKKWLITQEDIVYDKTNETFTANNEMIEKQPKKNPKEGNYIIQKREDGNLELIIKTSEKTMAWLFDIETTSDVYNLFGKSGKFPAKIITSGVKEGKVIDSGKIILGVQKDGYHEYKLEGDKFDTRLHVRVVPLDGKDTWVTWTGKKQTMLDSKEDEGVWDITLDRYNKLDLPESESA